MSWSLPLFLSATPDPKLLLLGLTVLAPGEGRYLLLSGLPTPQTPLPAEAASWSGQSPGPADSRVTLGKPPPFWGGKEEALAVCEED